MATLHITLAASSKYSTATELSITVNIGIGSELLYKLEEKDITSHLRGHFIKSIGNYLGSGQNTWWTVNNIQTAEIAANEIATIIDDKVLAEFNNIKTTEDWLIIGYKATEQD